MNTIEEKSNKNLGDSNLTLDETKFIVYDSPGTPTDTSIRTARTLTSQPVSTNSFFLFVTLSQCLFA